MTKMILFFRAFVFLIFVGAEARTLLGNHHGLNKLKAEIDGREPYIITSSPPKNEEIIVGRPYPLAPPAPRHDPVIGQLTTTSRHHEMPIILLPTTISSSQVGEKKHAYKLSPPPPPKPAGEDHQIIITSSSTTDHNMINSNHAPKHLPLQASY